METTTQSGTKVIITPVDGANLPSTLSELANSMKGVGLPSNAQIEQTLETAKEVIQEEKVHLGGKGKILAKDAEALIESTNTLIHERNRDDKLQRLFREGTEIAKQDAERIKEHGKALVGDVGDKLSGLSRLSGKAQEDAEDLYAYIRRLAWNFLRSEEFRELASDWIQMIHALTAEKIKKQAQKKRKLTHKGGKIAEAIDEGIEQPEKPSSEEELMEKTQEQFNKILDKISKNENFQKAIEDAYKFYDEVKERLIDVGESMEDESQEFKKVLDDALDIISEFTGKEELNRFRYLLSDTYQDVVSDKKLNNWLVDLKKFLSHVFKEPQSSKRVQESQELIRKGRAILQQAKWRKLGNSLYEQFNALSNKIKNDTVTQDFGEKLQNLAKDFALNDKGYPDLFVLEDSINQMKNLLIPLFKKQLDNLPIKRVDIINETYDVHLEDMIAVGSSFLPQKMDVHMRNDSHMDFQDSTQDIMKHQLEIEVANIKPEFKNMKFAYKRKSFPTISDFGVADLSFTGEGATIRVVWNIESSSGSHPVASLEEVSCTIDSLNIRIVGEATKHELLDTLLAPLVSGILKNKMVDVIQDYMRNQLVKINESLNNFFASRPTQHLKEKANQALAETISNYQQSISSI